MLQQQIQIKSEAVMNNSKNTLAGLAAALCMVLPSLVAAQEPIPNTQIVVEQPWARASLGTSRPAGAYLTLRNLGDTVISLTGLEADISGMASVHQSKTDANGISSMSPAGDIEIPVGGTVALEPGGYHAMLMKLQAPLIEGETFPMTLLFSDDTELTVDVPIFGMGARGPEG